MRALRSVALLFVVALWPSFASGQPKTAEEWNAVGVQHRKDLQPEKALEAFRKAHELAPSPKTRGQMGLVEHDLGQYVSAEQHLEEALSAEEDPWIKRNRRFLAEALALTQAHLAHVTIEGHVGAKVEVDGETVGNLPLSEPVSVAEGQISVVVSAPGFLPWEQRLAVTGGQRLALNADLVPDRRHLPGLAAPPPNEPPAPGSETNVVDRAPAAEPESGNTWHRPAGWTLVGVGAVLAGAAIWAHVTREPDCPANGRVCNELARSSWPTLGLAGGALLAGAGGITLLTW